MGSNSFLRLKEPTPRFLFVDSDSLVPRSLRRMLRTMRPSWKLVLADSPEDGFDQLDNHEFDVVVAEAEILEQSCPDFMRTAGQSSPRTTRVVHSVSIEWPMHTQAARGAQFILTKPLDAGEFLKTLDCALQAATSARDEPVQAC